MNGNRLRRTFLTLSAVVLLAICFLVALYSYFVTGYLHFDAVIFAAVVAGVSIIIFFLFLNSFIFRRLDAVLQLVKSFRSKHEHKQKQPDSAENELDMLRNEITAWADDRKNEIERLNKLEVYRKEFLGNVSHELKTPIFNIQGYVLTLLDGGLEDQAINREYLQRAEKSIDRMITIVDDLEAISQLETGELRLEPEKFDVVALARDVAYAQEMKATAKGIIITVQDDQKSIFVMADRFRIRQVLENLVVNSLKYGKEYGETKIRFYDVGENVLIEVADNGIGISKEHLPRLFERFYRVDKSRSREMGGTGLGLAIVKHIIEAHNQHISVMSTEGAGTVFSFALKKA